MQNDLEECGFESWIVNPTIALAIYSQTHPYYHYHFKFPHLIHDYFHIATQAGVKESCVDSMFKTSIFEEANFWS